MKTDLTTKFTKGTKKAGQRDFVLNLLQSNSFAVLVYLVSLVVKMSFFEVF